LEDAEEDDVLETKRNKKKPDGTKMTKDTIKKQGETATLSLKIDVMVNFKELLVIKTLEAKNEMMEKKNKGKGAKWNMLRKDAKHKTDVEERRARADENRAMVELIAAKNATMIMNPVEMDEFRFEW
jgi:hypothetical protein